MEAELEEESRSTGRREVRKQERRAAIVAAARESFLQRGYAATSMSALVETLGGSKATLWSYFRSKEELFAAVIDDVRDAFREQLEGKFLTDSTARDALTVFCGTFLDRISGPDAIAIWRLVVSESGRFPELGQIFYEHAPRQIENALACYLDSRIAAGELRDENPVEMAQFLIGLCAAQQTKRVFGVACGSHDVLATQFVDYFLRLFGRD